MNMLSNDSKSTIDIFDIVLTLVKKRKIIIIGTIIAAIFSVFYALIAPQFWLSRATILPMDDDASKMSIAGLLGGASSLIGQQGSSSAIEFITIMRSQQFTREIINHFHLIQYYKIHAPNKVKAMAIAEKKLPRDVGFGLDPNSNLVTISVILKDKVLSRDIANYYVSKLETYNLTSRNSKGRRNRVFLEERVNDTKKQIDSLATVLNHFQKENNAISLDDQTRNLVSMYTDLIAQIYQNDIALEYSRAFLNSNSSLINELKTKGDVLKTKVTNLEYGSSDSSPKYLLKIDNIPDLSREYAQLKMDMEIQSKVFEYLYPQYEAARIDELKDIPTIQVIDKATIAGLRARPKRALVCIFITISSFILLCLYVLFNAYIPIEQKRKISLIRNELYKK